MRMLYNGTTWAMSDDQLPDYISRSIDQPGSVRASHDGTGRRYTRYDKWSFDIPWSFVGTAGTDYVDGMAQLDGTVTLEYDRGTYVCRAVPGSYRESEVTYQAYNCSITLREI